MSFRSIVPALAAVVALVSPSIAEASSARVRVIHASPDAPSVDVLVNDALRAFQDVTFNEITDYAPVPAGVYNAKVVPTGGGPGSAVIDADLNLLYYKSYTVVAVGNLQNIEPLVLEDLNDPTRLLLIPGSALVRFVHASPDAPAVDIAVAGGPILFANVPFKGIGDYISVPAGVSVNLEVRLAGTDTVVLTIPGVRFEKGTTYTALATGLAFGKPGLGAIVAVDAAAPPLAIKPVGRGFANRR